MQRLILATLILSAAIGVISVFALGVRASLRDGALVPRTTEGTNVQKLAFIALFLLIAGVSTGLVGGL
jgi:hypothetical protein